LVLITG
jgi:hypothetical protein